ncbi:MAG: NUDIX domain-containing protein [Candidatus Saganbacteria bacterium]|nr:NUDIX domain-containing protein [Candidatus Saganbacteria bacterium]
MLEKVFSTALYCRAKIKLLDLQAKAQRIGMRLGWGAGNYAQEPSPTKEILPVLDEKGDRIGQATRKVVHEQGLWHPSVRLLIFDVDGRVLVQKRSLAKDSGGGKLAQSIGAHVPVGASNEATIVDEAREELGIDNPFSVSEVSIFPHVSREGTNKEMAHLFIGTYDGPFRPNPFEVNWVGWFRLEGIKKLAQQSPHLFSPSFLADLEHLNKA